MVGANSDNGFLMLSGKARYALKALLYLAGHPDRPVLIAEIAAAHQIPRKFLDAILLDMKNKGFLISKRGKGGGYQLALTPERIVIGAVLRSIDGPFAPIACASRSAYRPCDDCDNVDQCPIRLLMTQVRDAISAVLDTTTLADFCRLPQKAIPFVMYDI